VRNEVLRRRGRTTVTLLTAAENVEAKLAPTGVRNPDLRNRALALLEEVGLAERAIHLPTHYLAASRSLPDKVFRFYGPVLRGKTYSAPGSSLFP
jgi:2-polyprenyl-6-methoxyphenol hydroxylase-like FAD-dependent oxidoreductase